MLEVLTSLRMPTILGFALTLPFILLEVVNRWKYHERLPTPVFVSLWFLAATFVYLVRAVIQEHRWGLTLAIRILLLLLTAWLWFTVVTDQMPCFLGVPNCD